MAFLPTEQDKPDETPLSGGQQAPLTDNAPKLGGGGSFNGSTSPSAGLMGNAMTPNMGGGSSPSQQAQNAQNTGRSGRFTNLQTVMGQNTGLGQRVSNIANPLLDKAKTGLADTLGTVHAFTGDTNLNDQFGRDMLANPNLRYETTPGSGQFQTGMDRLKALYTQHSDNPESVNFDTSAPLQNADLVTDARTVGGAMAQGPYSGASGIGRMDQALFGGSADAQKTMQDTAKNLDAFRNDAKTKLEGANKTIADSKTAAQAARDNVKAQLQARGQGIVSGLQSKVDADNAAERARYGNMNQFYDGSGVHDVKPGQNVLGNWVGPAAGTGATLGNHISANDAGTMAALRSIMGADADPSFDVAMDNKNRNGYNGGNSKVPGVGGGYYAGGVDPNFVPAKPKKKKE